MMFASMRRAHGTRGRRPNKSRGNGKGGEYQLGPRKKPVISELKAVRFSELEELWIHYWGCADHSSTFHMT